MSLTPGERHRTSKRLTGFDYTQAGAYFITIVTYKRKCFLGEVIGDCVVLSPYGKITFIEWFKSQGIRQEIRLHDNEFMVMPNHIHGIVWFAPEDNLPEPENDLSVDVKAHGRAPLQVDRDTLHRQPRSLSSFIAGYKSSVTKQINKLRETPGSPVWMRNYHDRIIRNDRELRALCEYIRDNPLRWELDRENPMLASHAWNP
jgi:putative transposase